ncbi:hypothetical protein [Nonomuraea turkmeniaca]|nr:hypothetical protein [Nonomuraea turkmeniaca]
MDSSVPGGVPPRQAMVLLASDHVPDQLGGSYEDGCAALALEVACGD